MIDECRMDEFVQLVEPALVPDGADEVSHDVAGAIVVCHQAKLG